MKILPVILCLLTAATTFGHGVRYDVSASGTVVTARFDSGDPMASCGVKVFAPGETEKIFQTGMTDRNGRFAFAPDADGKWRIEVDDGTGHQVTMNIGVGPEGVHRLDAETHHHRWQGVLVGVCVIFGLFGILMLWRGRRGKEAG